MKEALKKIHFVGVGGVGMGTFAAALSKYGHTITGVDGKLYEPMKSVLEKANIKLFEGYSKSHPESIAADLVVIGNVVRKDNEEATAWIKKGTPFLSFPEAVRTFLIQDKKSIVCAGTHGKTTTTSFISFLLQETGLAPSYLIGGVPRDLESGCEIRDSEFCVLEGDEYDSSFFDKGPKFLHYYPWMVVLANVEFDHADIYRDLDHVKSSFEKLMALLPGDGHLLVRADDKVAMEVSKSSLARVQTFGKHTSALWRLGAVEETEAGFSFEILYKNRSLSKFQTPLFGEHNLMNLISGIACAINLGVPVEKIRAVVEKFRGARRRQEILLTSPVHIVDDFAHHPTEVTATLAAVRNRYKTGKLIALFEPRSATSRRAHHQEAYGEAFEAADVILVSEPHAAQLLKEEERFSSQKLVEVLKTKGKEAEVFSSVEAIVEYVEKSSQSGDVIAIMSNGEFGKIQEKLKHLFS